MTLADLTAILVTLKAMWTEHHAHDLITSGWCVHYIHTRVSASVGATFLVYAAVTIILTSFRADTTHTFRQEIHRTGAWTNHRCRVHTCVTTPIRAAFLGSIAVRVTGARFQADSKAERGRTRSFLHQWFRWYTDEAVLNRAALLVGGTVAIVVALWEAHVERFYDHIWTLTIVNDLLGFTLANVTAISILLEAIWTPHGTHDIITWFGNTLCRLTHMSTAIGAALLCLQAITIIGT